MSIIVCVRIAPSRWQWISVLGMSLYFGSKFFMRYRLVINCLILHGGHVLYVTYYMANLNTVCNKTFAPFTQSSHLVNSRGAWLVPSTEGTKIMPTGQMSARDCPS